MEQAETVGAESVTSSPQQPGFVVRRFATFAELPASYRRLSADTARENFSTSLAWFETFAATAMQESASLRVYGIEESHLGGEARGLLVAQTPAARRGSVLARRRVPRHSLSGLTGYQTYLFAPMVRSDDPDLDDILLCLARHLRRERPRWELIDFAAMDRDTPAFQGLARALRSVGYAVRSYPLFIDIFEPTYGMSYLAYRDVRKRTRRKQLKNLERQERQLKKQYSYSLKLINDESGLEIALRDFDAVHAASWKDTEYHPDFVPACIRACAQAGCLRLLLIYLDGKPVGALFVIITGNRALFYRTAYHQEYAKYSIGSILLLRMIQNILEKDHVEELDFGKDRGPHKRFFASNERTRFGILAFDMTTLAGLRALSQQLWFDLWEMAARFTRPLRKKLLDADSS